MYRIQIRQTSSKKPWYARIVSKNGRVQWTSETYANKPNAVRAARKFVDEVYDALLVRGEDAFTVEGDDA